MAMYDNMRAIIHAKKNYIRLVYIYYYSPQKNCPSIEVISAVFERIMHALYVESFMVGSSIRRYYDTIGCTLVVLCDGIMATDHICKWWHYTAHVHVSMCMWAITPSRI